MARSEQHDWSSFRRRVSRRPGQRRTIKRQPFSRRLWIEPLEDRRLLALVTVDTLNDTVDFDDGLTSLREAIFATNLVGGADTIDFAASLTSGGPATITLTQGELKITDSLTINGPGANLLTIDASGNDPTPDENNGDGSRIFNIDDGNSTFIDVSIGGLTLTGGDVTGSGGAIYSLENLTVTLSTISGNSAGFFFGYPSSLGSGGGIFSSSGDLTVTASTISGNSATSSINSLGSGGGIYSGVGILTVTNSTISGNSASGSGYTYGGGIRSVGYLTVTNSTISGNSAALRGGGIAGTAVTVMNSTISGNSSGSNGGGILGAVAVTVTNSTISGNSASINGGGVAALYSDVIVRHSTITGNTANSNGGGIFSLSSNVTVTDSTISGNSARGVSGGGIASNYGNLTVTGSTISDNSAGGNGGGIWGSGTITSSTISGNSAGGNGGGIWANFSLSLTVTSSTVSRNSAVGNGGGVFLNAGGTIRHSTIAFNSAGIGGGVFLVGGTLAMGHTISAQNFASIGRDLTGLFGAIVNPSYSLIGSNANSGLAAAPVGAPDANGNLIGGPAGPFIDPLLGPLVDNGGSTKTHALLVGSPAIDAGNPAAVAGAGGVPATDQRGAPFGRVFGGRIDIGAVESQPIPPAIFGDYDQNGHVDAADYITWRKMLGSNVTPYSSADGNGNGVVDQSDYGVWRAHFGQTLPSPAAASGTTTLLEHAEPIAPVEAATGEAISVGSSVSEPNEAVELQGASGEEQAPSQRENSPPVLVVLAPLLSPYRPAVRSTLGAQQTIAASRRDEALVAWLATHPDTNKHLEDSGIGESWIRDGVSDADDLHMDPVEQVFAQLANN